jgi:hypothetical protein
VRPQIEDRTRSELPLTAALIKVDLADNSQHGRTSLLHLRV